MPTNQPHRASVASDPEAHRELMRRGMLRANAALGVILAAVLALALVTVLAGVRAERNQRRAEDAEWQSRQRLWHSYLAQARASRLTGQMGRRNEALTAISNAVAIQPSLELRNETIASLALLDVDDRGVSVPPTEPSVADFDRTLSRYAFADADRKVRVRRMSDREELFVLDANAVVPKAGGAVQNVLFSPDGRHLGVRCRGGAVVVWDLSDQQVTVLAGQSATNTTLGSIVFDTESGCVMFANADRDGQISVFDTATGLETHHYPIKAGARYFRFKPGDTNVLALATDNNIELTEMSSRRTLASLAHSSRVSFFRWSEQGERLFAACQNGDVNDWNVPNQSFRVLSGHGESCICLLESRDGEMLVTGSRDGTSRFWDLRTGRAVLEAKRGIALQLDASGSRAVYWQPGNGYGLWEIHRSEIFRSEPTDVSAGALLTFDLSTDGRWSVGTQNKGFRLWDHQTGFNQFFPLTNLLSARLTTDAKALLLCLTDGLEIWPFELSQAASNQPTQVIFGVVQKIAVPEANGVRAVAVSHDGRTIVAEAGSLVTSVVDLRGERKSVVLAAKPNGRWLRGPGSPTGAGRFVVSPDGRWLAQGVGYGTHPVIFDTGTGQRAKELDGDAGMAAFSDDGQSLVIATTKGYDIYSVGGWERTRTLPRDEISTTYGAAALSGDGAFAAISPTRQAIRLVELHSGKTLAEFQSPARQAINSLRLSADGGTLTAAMADDSLHVWNLKNLRAHLSALKLDWTQDDGSAPVERASPTPDRSWHLPLAVGLALVAVAGVAAALVLRRHRSLVRDYLATEALSMQRSRELKTAKDELLHGQKMRALGAMAAGIAHDFNNLLSVIRMSNKLIARETPGNAEVQEHAADIEQAVLQGKHVVGSMLGYARNEVDDAQPADMNAVVEETVSLLTREFLSGIALTLELDRHAPPVKIARGRLEQVLLNLVVNASEAMQGQGKLKIVVRTRETQPDGQLVLRPQPTRAYVELSVTDSGPGISTEIRDRIFEPFFTTKRAGAKAGTGLGLSLVYSIAQQDGLGLRMESAPGKGATFLVLIPTVEPK